MEDGIEQNMSILLNELDIIKQKNITNTNTNININNYTSTNTIKCTILNINTTKEPFSWCLKNS